MHLYQQDDQIPCVVEGDYTVGAHFFSDILNVLSVGIHLAIILGKVKVISLDGNVRALGYLK